MSQNTHIRFSQKDVFNLPLAYRRDSIQVTVTLVQKPPSKQTEPNLVKHTYFSFFYPIWTQVYVSTTSVLRVMVRKGINWEDCHGYLFGCFRLHNLITCFIIISYVKQDVPTWRCMRRLFTSGLNNSKITPDDYTSYRDGPANVSWTRVLTVLPLPHTLRPLHSNVSGRLDLWTFGLQRL